MSNFLIYLLFYPRIWHQVELKLLSIIKYTKMTFIPTYQIYQDDNYTYLLHIPKGDRGIMIFSDNVGPGQFALYA